MIIKKIFFLLLSFILSLFNIFPIGKIDNPSHFNFFIKYQIKKENIREINEKEYNIDSDGGNKLTHQNIYYYDINGNILKIFHKIEAGKEVTKYSDYSYDKKNRNKQIKIYYDNNRIIEIYENNFNKKDQLITQNVSFHLKNNPFNLSNIISYKYDKNGNLIYEKLKLYSNVGNYDEYSLYKFDKKNKIIEELFTTHYGIEKTVSKIKYLYSNDNILNKIELYSMPDNKLRYYEIITFDKIKNILIIDYFEDNKIKNKIEFELIYFQ